MPETQPNPTPARAVVVTSCPLLALQVSELHPAVGTALLTRLAGIGALRDCDAVLLLTSRDRHDPTAVPAAGGLVTTTIYVGTDLDDADVWARAVRMHADDVLFLPDHTDRIAGLLSEHLGASA